MSDGNENLNNNGGEEQSNGAEWQFLRKMSMREARQRGVSIDDYLNGSYSQANTEANETVNEEQTNGLNELSFSQETVTNENVAQAAEQAPASNENLAKDTQEARARWEMEQKARWEMEQKARMEQEQAAKAEQEERKKALEEEYNRLKEENERLTKEYRLTAINADFSADKKDLAHDLAEQELNKEVADIKVKSPATFIKKLWKGTIAKKYYETKYEREYLEGTRTVGEDEEKMTVDEIIESRKDSALKRFELGIAGDLSFIHSEIGKKSKNGEFEDGEKYEEADEETQAFVKDAVSEFIKDAQKNDKHLTSEELKLMFQETFDRKVAEAKDEGKEINTLVNNYEDVALQALELCNHNESMEKVMEGFKVYNARVRDGVRTEAHRDLIDKITNGYESLFEGKHTFVPPELVALAATTAISITQMGARSLLSSVAAPAGIVFSSAVSGLRERNRITEDRARMMRDRANGLEYKGKYEKKIGGTLYDCKNATDLVAEINNAQNAEGEDKDDGILRAIAEARVRIDFSDAEQKDLIAYSSADKRGKERLDLDLAVISAEKALNEDEKAKLEEFKKQIQKEIFDDVKKDDKKFENKRALMATAKAGKTFAIGAVTFFGSQEVTALLSKDQIGILEKIGLAHTENNVDAKETILASGFGLNRGTYTRDQFINRNTIDVKADNQAEIDKLNAEGYSSEVIKEASKVPTIQKEITEVDPSSSNLSWNVKVDGWANNGTKIPDGNETRMFIENGKMIARMSGTSTMGNETIDIQSITDSGNLKAFITLGGKRFEVLGNGAGEFGNGNGMFDVIGPNGSIGSVQALGENGEPLYKYFEVVMDNGVGQDGLRHIIPLATATGSNSFDGTISQIIETPVTTETPAVLRFTKDIINTITETRGVSMAGGIAFAPETIRTGLGEAVPIQEQEEQELNGPESNGPESGMQEPGEQESSGTSSGSGEAAQEINEQQEPANTAPETNTAAQNNEAQAEATTAETAATTGAAGETISAEADNSTAENQPASRREQLLYEYIEGIKDEIGGDEGRNILLETGSPSISNLDPNNRYSNWWNSLQDSQKSQAKTILRQLREIENDYIQNNTSVDDSKSAGARVYNWLISQGIIS